MPHALTLAAATVTLLPALAACSSGGDAPTGIAITAEDSSCKIERTNLDAGQKTFTVKNNGSKVTEVYVYGRNGDEFTSVITEVENIGPGTTRDMSVDLAAGTYEIACKPGQTGDGIRTRITVAGNSSSTASAGNQARYDREIELSTDGTTISGVPAHASRGERIEFKLRNHASGPRTLEVKSPAGAVAGEAENIAAGEDGELILDLHTPGAWQIIVEGPGVDDIVTPLNVS